MKITFTLILLLVFWINYGFAQDKIPAGLYRAIEKYLNDENRFKSDLIGFQLDTNIKVEEIKIGIPIKIYSFKQKVTDDFLEALDFDSPVMSYVKHFGYWVFVLKAREKYLYEVEFCDKNGYFEWVRSGIKEDEWDKIRSTYSETSTTIIVNTGVGRFLHFPHINNHNLTLITSQNFRNDIRKELTKLKNTKNQDTSEINKTSELLSITTDTYISLADSKTVLRYLKHEINRAKEYKKLYFGGSNENTKK